MPANPKRFHCAHASAIVACVTSTDTPVATAAVPAVHLKKTLGPVMLWGLGVGYVISGEYFGWNLGLPLGGTYGMLIATALVTVMYVAFVFSYTELACALPHAGGVFVYTQRAFGPFAGFLGASKAWPTRPKKHVIHKEM